MEAGTDANAAAVVSGGLNGISVTAVEQRIVVEAPGMGETVLLSVEAIICVYLVLKDSEDRYAQVATTYFTTPPDNSKVRDFSIAGFSATTNASDPTKATVSFTVEGNDFAIYRWVVQPASSPPLLRVRIWAGEDVAGSAVDAACPYSG